MEARGVNVLNVLNAPPRRGYSMASAHMHTAAKPCLLSGGLQPGTRSTLSYLQKGTSGLLLATDEHLYDVLLCAALALPEYSFPLGGLGAFWGWPAVVYVQGLLVLAHSRIVRSTLLWAACCPVGCNDGVAETPKHNFETTAHSEVPDCSHRLLTQATPKRDEVLDCARPYMHPTHYAGLPNPSIAVNSEVILYCCTEPMAILSKKKKKNVHPTTNAPRTPQVYKEAPTATSITPLHQQLCQHNYTQNATITHTTLTFITTFIQNPLTASSSHFCCLFLSSSSSPLFPLVVAYPCDLEAAMLWPMTPLWAQCQTPKPSHRAWSTWPH